MMMGAILRGASWPWQADNYQPVRDRREVVISQNLIARVISRQKHTAAIWTHRHTGHRLEYDVIVATRSWGRGDQALVLPHHFG